MKLFISTVIHKLRGYMLFCLENKKAKIFPGKKGIECDLLNENPGHPTIEKVNLKPKIIHYKSRWVTLTG